MVSQVIVQVGDADVEDHAPEQLLAIATGLAPLPQEDLGNLGIARSFAVTQPEERERRGEGDPALTHAIEPARQEHMTSRDAHQLAIRGTDLCRAGKLQGNVLPELHRVLVTIPGELGDRKTALRVHDRCLWTRTAERRSGRENEREVPLRRLVSRDPVGSAQQLAELRDHWHQRVLGNVSAVQNETERAGARSIRDTEEIVHLGERSHGPALGLGREPLVALHEGSPPAVRSAIGERAEQATPRRARRPCVERQLRIDGESLARREPLFGIAERDALSARGRVPVDRADPRLTEPDLDRCHSEVLLVRRGRRDASSSTPTRSVATSASLETPSSRPRTWSTEP
jgi:hypothetical protein